MLTCLLVYLSICLLTTSVLPALPLQGEGIQWTRKGTGTAAEVLARLYLIFLSMFLPQLTYPVVYLSICQLTTSVLKALVKTTAGRRYIVE